MCCISCPFIKFNDSHNIPTEGVKTGICCFWKWPQMMWMLLHVCAVMPIIHPGTHNFLIYLSVKAHSGCLCFSLSPWLMCTAPFWGEGWSWWWGGVTDYPQPRWETYPSFSPWALVWVLSYVETRRIKPQRVKHDTTKWYSYTQLITRV